MSEDTKTKLTSDALDELIKQLKSSDSNTQRSAIVKIGKFKDAKAALALIGAFGYVGDFRQRMVLVDSVTEIGEQAIEPLIIALQDQELRVRQCAAQALRDISSKVKDSRAGDALIRALEDDDSDIRGDAALALRNLNYKPAVKPLAIALNQGRLSNVADNAKNSLVELVGPEDKEIIPILEKRSKIVTSMYVELLLYRWQKLGK